MNRRSFLRFAALAPLAAVAAPAAVAEFHAAMARAQAAARAAGAITSERMAGYRLVCNELHEFSCVRVPWERATWIMNPDAIRELEAL